MSQRLWFKIGEAAELVGVSPREVRYWEKIIPELRPRRSKGNLRYYHQDDLPRLRIIAVWIKQGFTVADCRELLQTGCITRDLGMDVESFGGHNQEEAHAQAPQPTKRKSEPGPGGGEETHAESTAIDLSAPISPQFREHLREIIDSMKNLLSHLQKPVS